MSKTRDRANSDCSETDKKRGREEDERKGEADIFRRSKITIRSPNSNKQIEKEEMEGFTTLMQTWVTEIKDEIKSNKNETLAAINKNADEIQKLRNELKVKEECWNKEKTQLIGKIEEIENKLERYEKERRKNNIVVNGIKVDTDNEEVLKEGIVKFIKEEMKIDVKVKSMYKIGPEACVVAINSWEEKLEILKNKYKLKGTKVYINNDLTKKERQIQIEISRTAKLENENGNRTRIGYQKLTINGKQWVWNKTEAKLETKN